MLLVSLTKECCETHITKNAILLNKEFILPPKPLLTKEFILPQKTDIKEFIMPKNLLDKEFIQYFFPGLYDLQPYNPYILKG